MREELGLAILILFSFSLTQIVATVIKLCSFLPPNFRTVNAVGVRQNVAILLGLQALLGFTTIHFSPGDFVVFTAAHNRYSVRREITSRGSWRIVDGCVSKELDAGACPLRICRSGGPLGQDSSSQPRAASWNSILIRQPKPSIRKSRSKCTPTERCSHALYATM